MRPLTMFCNTTTGWPWTAKWRSWWSGEAAMAVDAANRRSPKLHTLKVWRCLIVGCILVVTPAAFHHRGEQIGLLLIRSIKVFTRQLILRILLQMLLALGDKRVQSAQILAKRSIHLGIAGELHV